jgi:mono/diheme cytochrome c family protein
VRGRPALAWGVVGLALAGTAVALALAPLPPSPRGPEPGRTLYQAHCATCHGAAGRGDTWRARLLLLRPGDLSSPALASLTDRYLAEIVRHGGATFGKPGMPSFGFVLSDEEIEAVILYVRTLPRAPRDLGRREAPPAGRGPGPALAGIAESAGRAGRDRLVPAGPHALVEDPGVEPAHRHELDAVSGAAAGARGDALGRDGAIPVRPGRALGLVEPALGLGRARPLPSNPGGAGRAPDRRQQQESMQGSPHVPIVSRTDPA